jgi:hypothetical protein
MVGVPRNQGNCHRLFRFDSDWRPEGLPFGSARLLRDYFPPVSGVIAFPMARLKAGTSRSMRAL